MARVVRPRTRLRVELERTRPQIGVLEPLDRAVVERHVRRLAALARLDSEAVVLARHEHAPGRALEHGMVRAPMPEGELRRLVPGRAREQLVAEADAESRDAAGELGHG